VDHLRQLRALQDETCGFTGFVPLAYHPEDNDIPVKHPPTGFDRSAPSPSVASTSTTSRTSPRIGSASG